MLALVGAGVGLPLVPESAGSLTVSDVCLREVGLNTRTVSELTLPGRRTRTARCSGRSSRSLPERWMRHPARKTIGVAAPGRRPGGSMRK